jgi:hypothetical protein
VLQWTPETAFILLSKPEFLAPGNSLRVAIEIRNSYIQKQLSWCLGKETFVYPETASVLLWKPELGVSINSHRVTMETRLSYIQK